MVDKDTRNFLNKHKLGFKLTGVKDRILQKMLVKNDCDMEPISKLLYKQFRDDSTDASLAHNKAIFLAVIGLDLTKSEDLFEQVYDAQLFKQVNEFENGGRAPQLEQGWQINWAIVRIMLAEYQGAIQILEECSLLREASLLQSFAKQKLEQQIKRQQQKM